MAFFQEAASRARPDIHIMAVGAGSEPKLFQLGRVLMFLGLTLLLGLLVLEAA